MSVTCEEKAPEITRLNLAGSRSDSPTFTPYRVWRVAISGFSFALFMGAALGFALLVFPTVRLFSRTSEAKGRRTRRVIQFMFGQFLKFWTLIGVMQRPQIEGLESLDGVGPCIIVANHPTLIDALLLGSQIGDFNCVVKSSLRDHLFLGGPIRAAGYVKNDEPLQIIRQCAAGFQRGQSLIIFPEGSRSIENGLRPFSRGAAQLALRSGVPLIPAVIRCSPPSLMKHQRWHDVPDRPFQLSIKFHPPLAYAPADSTAESLARKARRFTGQLEDFFLTELNRDTVRGSSDPS